MLLFLLKYTLIRASITDFERNVGACKLYTQLFQHNSTNNNYSNVNMFVSNNSPVLSELNAVNMSYSKEYNKKNTVCEYKLAFTVS